MKLTTLFFTGVFFLTLLRAGPLPAQTIEEGKNSLEVEGVIEPYRIVEVGSETAGILDKVHLDRGDMVRAGQKVATLKSGVERATLKIARARSEMQSEILAKQRSLEFAERNYTRIKELYDAKAQPYQKLDEMETQKRLAALELSEAIEKKRLYELEYEQAGEVVKRKTVLSPISGVVMERYLSKGEYVEDKPIIKAAQVDPLNVEVVMPVSEIGFVKTGMKGIVKPESPVKGQFEAVVTIVDKFVDAASGTFGVRLELPNKKYEIPPGLKCKVVFKKP